jgi:ElaB/YqjD/DUF883 family membrane-anchored ribosome-binding protein
VARLNITFADGDADDKAQTRKYKEVKALLKDFKKTAKGQREKSKRQYKKLRRKQQQRLRDTAS